MEPKRKLLRTLALGMLLAFTCVLLQPFAMAESKSSSPPGAGLAATMLQAQMTPAVMIVQADPAKVEPEPATKVPLPAKIIAIATTVFSILGGLKKVFPQLGGWYGIAFNVAFTAIGTLAVAKPDDLLSFNFLAQLAITALGAAGLHGISKNVVRAET
jgi:hypothetical protein